MLDDLDLRTIRAFVAVVEAGDFTAAARTLGMTRSAVGKALRRLESGLGVRLLHRTTRRVSTTSDGAVFHERCVRLLADLAEAADAVCRQPQEPRGTLRLSLPDAYGRRRLLPILQAYMRRYPAVAVEATFSDRIADLVEEGLDLAIRIGGATADDAAGGGLITRAVDRIGGVLCASPVYLQARGTPGEEDALHGHDLLLFGQRGRIMAWPGRDPAAARWVPRLVLDSAEALRAFALEGFGIAHLPDFLVADDVESGRLVLLPCRPAQAIAVNALYPERRLLPLRVRLFLDMVVDGLR